jgi:outer membrane protein assembly factor BamD (BamD/ComL family)
MKNKILATTIMLLLLFSILTQASDEKEKYALACQAAKSGNKEAAFLSFLDISRQHLKSKIHEDALFAVGEYYFEIADYRDAFNAFNKFSRDYSESKKKPFAVFYLYKTAQLWGKETLEKEFREEIINLKQVVLVFSQAKEYKYTSPFCIKYKLAYYIDKVELYVNGELFAKVTY